MTLDLSGLQMEYVATQNYVDTVNNEWKPSFEVNNLGNTPSNHNLSYQYTYDSTDKCFEISSKDNISVTNYTNKDDVLNIDTANHPGLTFECWIKWDDNNYNLVPNRQHRYWGYIMSLETGSGRRGPSISLYESIFSITSLNK